MKSVYSYSLTFPLIYARPGVYNPESTHNNHNYQHPFDRTYELGARNTRSVPEFSESMPEPRLNLLPPSYFNNDHDNEDSEHTISTNPPEFYKKYELRTRTFRPNEHVISVSKNLTNSQFARVQNILSEQNNKATTRSFDDFVKMTFWSAVLSNLPNGHEFNDVHEISLTDSTNWWKDNFVNHGCYCWPEQETRLQNLASDPNALIESQRISGFGQATDPLDHECFDLYSCYRCVSLMPECKEIDWVTSHYDCEFVSTLKNNDGTNSTRLELRCSDVDPCMQSLCECDRKFALAAKDKLQQKNSNNSKIFPGACQKKENDHPNKKCCGSWPNVKPYSPDNKCCSKESGFREIVKIGEAICDHLEEDQHPSWEDLYEGSEVGLNFLNPEVINHDHNGSHEFADHIHP